MEAAMRRELIGWREEFRIGLPEVDEDHRALIQDINRLHGEFAGGANVWQVAGTLGDVHSAIAAHFALEEKDMAALQYDGLDAHKAEHERLLDEILDIIEELVSSGRYDASELAARLSAWFGVHFRTQDARLHRWLAGRGGAP
jgi:hemerythrin